MLKPEVLREKAKLYGESCNTQVHEAPWTTGHTNTPSAGGLYKALAGPADYAKRSRLPADYALLIRNTNALPCQTPAQFEMRNEPSWLAQVFSRRFDRHAAFFAIYAISQARGVGRAEVVAAYAGAERGGLARGSRRAAVACAACS